MILAMLTIISCKEDLGNYDYSEINSLDIKNINAHYVVEIGTTPNITPTLSFSKDPNFKEENYSYEWISFNKTDVSNSNSRKLIHNGKDFKIPLILGLGNYSVYYRVTEKSTGISWSHNFTIDVTGTLKGGWLILSEVDNNSQLDYFELDFGTDTYPKEYRKFEEYFTDIEGGSKLTLEGTPKFIEGWTNTVAADNNRAKYYIYIGTDKATHKINTSDGFIWKDKYNFQFESLNSALLPNLDFLTPLAANASYGFKEGNLYKRYNVFNINFGTPINVINEELVSLAPHIAINRAAGTTTAVLAFDTKYKRFLKMTSQQGTSLSSNLPNTFTGLNPNDTQMDLVWMGSTYFGNGLAYAILTKDSKYYLARMTNTVSAFEIKYFTEITHLTDIAKAKLFEIDQVYGYLQYAAEGKLYQYDVDQNAVKLMKDYGSREITLLKHNKGVHVNYSSATNTSNKDKQGKRFLPVITALICATYDPSSVENSGKVEFFQPGQFNADFNLLYSFENLPKVKDVTNVELPTGY